MNWVGVTALRALSTAAPWSDAAIIAAPLAVVLAAIVGGIVSVVVRRQNKAVDEATVHKAVAESRKAAAETTAIEVTIARGLLDEVRGMLDTQRAHYESRLGDLTGQLKGLNERVSSNEEQQRKLRAAFASHATWDGDAIAALRSAHPDWPDPPPIDLDD
ncbi:hypothetical protein [Micromonospora chalcea]|uniref:hypothetical protein n=1 Tax=Micromonospora chalcea TaxID=1874 RepID=UPI003D7095A4